MACPEVLTVVVALPLWAATELADSRRTFRNFMMALERRNWYSAFAQTNQGNLSRKYREFLLLYAPRGP